MVGVVGSSPIAPTNKSFFIIRRNYGNGHTAGLATAAMEYEACQRHAK